MNHPKRGMALVFNHENFDYHTGMNRRVGSSHDVENLKVHLGRLGFDVMVFQDVTAMEVMKSLMLGEQYNAISCSF